MGVFLLFCSTEHCKTAKKHPFSQSEIDHAIKNSYNSFI
jgi:hypothetical protein